MNKSNQFLALIILLFSISLVNAQDMFDLNGSFEGIHYEFDQSENDDTLEYFYKLELVQDSNKISGKSYVYNDEGYYAVVKVRGFVVEDKIYFEEYNTIDEINPEAQLWCYNSGHLDIATINGVTQLTGFTKSYTKGYGNFCRKGSTKLVRTSIPIEIAFEEEAENEQLIEYNPLLAPNPTPGETVIKFNLLKAETVIIEVYDLSGELKKDVLRQNLSPGVYNYYFDLSFEPDGMYVVELIVGTKLYSTEIWKGIQ